MPTIQLYSRRRAVLSAVEYKQRAMDLGKGRVNYTRGDGWLLGGDV